MSQDSISHSEAGNPESLDHNDGHDGTVDSGVRTPVRGLRSHNVVVDGKRTSIRLDPVSLGALQDISRRERISVNDLCTMIWNRNKGNDFTFTAAIRIFLLSYYRKAATEEGHELAGHGRARPLVGTPFEEPASLKATQPRPRNGRGRPPQSAKPGHMPETRTPIRLGEPTAQAQDLAAN